MSSYWVILLFSHKVIKTFHYKNTSNLFWLGLTTFQMGCFDTLNSNMKVKVIFSTTVDLTSNIFSFLGFQRKNGCLPPHYFSPCKKILTQWKLLMSTKARSRLIGKSVFIIIDFLLKRIQAKLIIAELLSYLNSHMMILQSLH